jgi:hypothetical protein
MGLGETCLLTETWGPLDEGNECLSSVWLTGPVAALHEPSVTQSSARIQSLGLGWPSRTAPGEPRWLI